MIWPSFPYIAMPEVCHASPQKAPAKIDLRRCKSSSIVSLGNSDGESRNTYFVKVCEHLGFALA
jgi:hypothetical protein